MFYRDYDRAGDGDSGNMQFPATVSTFRLDKYEVTVGRFRAFLNAGMGIQRHPPPAGAGAHDHIAMSGWESQWNDQLAPARADLMSALRCQHEQDEMRTRWMWTDSPANNEHMPMNCVTWYEAAAFCAWDGGYLPTTAEANYAAAGGDEQRAFPWSIPPSSLVFGPNQYSEGALLPVGSKPGGNGRWGQSDLLGNLAEWTLDWYGVHAVPCTDCMDAPELCGADPECRTQYGATAGNSGRYVRLTTIRWSRVPGDRGQFAGFRCARSP